MGKDGNLHPDLAAFQGRLGATHALQVVQHEPQVDADRFARTAPTVVPARTFVSQLL